MSLHVYMGIAHDGGEKDVAGGGIGQRDLMVQVVQREQARIEVLEDGANAHGTHPVSMIVSDVCGHIASCEVSAKG